MFTSLLRVAYLASLAFQTASAIPTISVKGNKFFANGQQFYIKGVAYQGTPSDPLVDTTQCQLDAASMKTIGTNSIRVYHVDPYVNHDGCMDAFSDAGIYVWLDLDTFNTTIYQGAPGWTQTQLEAFALVMDVFQGYGNLGGFWIGNEVIDSAAGSVAAPYVKAAVADMKMYMTTKNYREIPIGYSAADIAELRPMLQNYLACGDSSASIDFYGLNSYEWCGAATYDTSGYSNLQNMSYGYSIPIFFSETGCNVGGERTFADQDAIFGPAMVDTWSGSIIYEWVQETNDYGLVTYPNGQIYSGAPIPISPDYNNLANVWKGINPTGVAESNFSPSFSAPACPLASNGWAINGDVAIPSLGAAAVKAAAAQQSISQVSVSASTTTSVAHTTSGTTPSPIPVTTTSVAPPYSSSPVASTSVASTSSSAPVPVTPVSSQMLSSSIVTVTAGTSILSQSSQTSGSPSSVSISSSSSTAQGTTSTSASTFTTGKGTAASQTTSSTASPSSSKSAGHRAAMNPIGLSILPNLASAGAVILLITVASFGAVALS